MAVIGGSSLGHIGSDSIGSLLIQSCFLRKTSPLGIVSDVPVSHYCDVWEIRKTAKDNLALEALGSRNVGSLFIPKVG